MIKEYLAPAKINLYLQVLGRRDDGYHELAMVMQRISLFDRLRMELTADAGVTVACPGVALAPGEDNIAVRAAQQLLQEAGLKTGLRITIDKQIPVAAGLGGGSSDAATVLMGVNEMLQLGFSREELMRRAKPLGADVPFFVFQQDAWATGIGDVLTEVAGLPPAWYLLVNPRIAVSTGWVYGNLGLTSEIAAAKLPGFPTTAKDLVHLVHNDLERVTIPAHPVVAQVKQQLLTAGAVAALMSGSGPTVFGVFDDEAAAQQACQVVQRDHDWWAALVQPLSAEVIRQVGPDRFPQI